MTRYRILETIRQGQIGGGESHLLSLVENLNKSIFEPVVLSFTPGPMIERLQQMNIQTHVIHTEKPFDISKWQKVRSFIENEKIQLIHAHGTRANSNVFWAAKKLNLPLVYTIHGWSFHDDQNPLVKMIRVAGEKLLTQRSDTNISVAESNQATGKKHFKNFQSVIINNGINQTKFNPDKNFANIREELHIAGNEIVIVFIARFIQQKQPLVLIKSFAKALQQISSLKLLMVGDGDQKKEALQQVKQLQIENNVIFQPFRQDVPDILAASDIYVLPSLWEGLPIGLLEAMAMGKAIIATNADGTREVLKHNCNGILLPIENIEEQLTATILQIATDTNTRKKFGEAAKATISERFSANKMTRAIENVYLKLLE